MGKREHAREHVERALELVLELIVFLEGLRNDFEERAMRDEVINELKVISARLSRALYLMGSGHGKAGEGS